MNGIARALDDWPATQARARAARRRIVEELSFARRMQRVEAIYEELMARPAGRDDKARLRATTS
jgi:hypothetical protein